MSDAPLFTDFYGTVSRGTLNTVHLLRAFGRHLAACADNPADKAIAGEAIGAAALEIDDIALLETVSAVLETYAPVGYYFGTHPESSSDFGFWPIDPLDAA